MTNTKFSNLCLALKCSPRNVSATFSSMSEKEVDFLHGAIGACEETGELLSVAKKRLIYGKEIDVVNVMEEIGDTLLYLTYMCGAVDITFEQCMEANRRKLRKRYPGGFNTMDALNRDLDGEQKELENDL